MSIFLKIFFITKYMICFFLFLISTKLLSFHFLKWIFLDLILILIYWIIILLFFNLLASLFMVLIIQNRIFLDKIIVIAVSILIFTFKNLKFFILLFICSLIIHIIKGSSSFFKSIRCSLNRSLFESDCTFLRWLCSFFQTILFFNWLLLILFNLLST